MEYFDINDSKYLNYSIIIKNNFREVDNIILSSNKTTEGFIEGMYDYYDIKLKPLYEQQTQLNNDITNLNNQIKNKNSDIFIKDRQLNFLTKNILTTVNKSSYTTTSDNKKYLTNDLTDLQNQLDSKKTSLNNINTEISKLEIAKKVQKDNFYLEEYKPKSSTQNCSFYFNTNSFNCIYSVLPNVINFYIEINIILNDSNFCFNTDGNILYSKIENTIYSYNTIDNNTKKKYPVQFNIIVNNSSLVDCLLKFIENGINTSRLIINVDSEKNIIKLSTLNKQNNCMIYLKKTDLNISIQNNLDNANIIKILYLDKKMDLNKKYSYGRLIYTGSNIYDCIVLNN